MALQHLHQKYIGEFIIKSNENNDEEEQKINRFYKSNPSMINIESKKAFDDIVVGKNNTNESNIKDNKNSSKNILNEEEFNKAFTSKDRIARTPPGEIK